LAAPGVEGVMSPAISAAESLWGAVQPVSVVLDSLDDMYWHFRHLQGREAWQVDGGFIERYAPPLGAGVAERFTWSKGVTDAQAAAGHAFRERFKAHLDELLGENGVLVLPSMPDIAPRRTDAESTLEDYRNRAIRMLCVSGLTGLPQISLPLGRKDGAPLGISLLGPRGSDRSLVRLAQAWVQKAQTAW
jgi:amidase